MGRNIIHDPNGSDSTANATDFLLIQMCNERTIQPDFTRFSSSAKHHMSFGEETLAYRELNVILHDVCETRNENGVGNRKDEFHLNGGQRKDCTAWRLTLYPGSRTIAVCLPRGPGKNVIV